MKNLTKKVIVLCAFVFCSALLYATDDGKIKFNAKDIYNNDITETVFENAEITMINVWGTFCGPCIREMPELASLNKKNASRKFQLLGIVIDGVDKNGQPVKKKIDSAKKIAEKTGADYIHIIPDEMLLYLLSDVYYVPVTFFVDKNGKQVGSAYSGSRTYEDWQQIVDEILKSEK